jgi:hypothetical protein
LVVSLAWKPAPYVEQLIRIQAKQDLAHIDRAILDEPLPVQALLLDYSRDKELVLKAWIALSKYPANAREILLLYGSESEFQNVLRRYGDSVIPVIQYFRENDVWTVKAMDATGKAFKSVAEAAKELWRRVTGNEEGASKPAALPKPVELGPTERGWYAVNFIRDEGHDFLGQFAVGADKKARWNQVDRIVKASASFFTSGVRNLETRMILAKTSRRPMYFWAGLDVAMVALPAKLLVGGKAVARSGQELNLTTRTRLFAPRLVAKGQIFRKLGTYGAAAATIYIVATHPSLLNSVFAEIAGLIGHKPLAGAGGGLVGGDRVSHLLVFVAAGTAGEIPAFSAEADRTWGRCSLKKYTGLCARARPAVECSLDLDRSTTTVDVDANGVEMGRQALPVPGIMQGPDHLPLDRRRVSAGAALRVIADQARADAMGAADVRDRRHQDAAHGPGFPLCGRRSARSA